jgi:hypothetical protein
MGQGLPFRESQVRNDGVKRECIVVRKNSKIIREKPVMRQEHVGENNGVTGGGKEVIREDKEWDRRRRGGNPGQTTLELSRPKNRTVGHQGRTGRGRRPPRSSSESASLTTWLQHTQVLT